jgi:hypothetical protein
MLNLKVLVMPVKVRQHVRKVNPPAVTSSARAVVPETISNHLTSGQADRLVNLINKFGWPGEKAEAIRLPPGQQYRNMVYKVVLRRSKYRGRYPIDEDASVIYYKPDSQIHVEMDPRLFLWVSTKQSMESFMTPEQFRKSFAFSEISHENIHKRWDKGGKMDPLFLDMNWNTATDQWEVTSHEGRHRAMVAYEKGLEKVPVIIFTQKKRHMVPIWDFGPHQLKKLEGILNTWLGRKV